MDIDSEPFQQSIFFLESLFKLGVGESLSFGLIGIIVLSTFLILSAFFSSSENAYFSLGPNDLVKLNEENTTTTKLALDLINEPDRKVATRRLLGTILLMNNLVNIFIIIYSSYVFEHMFNFPTVNLGLFQLDTDFVVQVVLITFLLVLIGEIIPKIYATQNNLKIVKFMARPLKWSYTIFKPVILLLAASSSVFDKYLKKRLHSVSMEEISQAIDIAHEDSEIEEKNILKGIINFGNTSVRQIMTPRTAISGIEIETSAQEVMKIVSDWSLSRIPVFEENFDKVKGILYIKDLLPYLHNASNFKWQVLIKPPIFVPEHKKIDVLLEEFQDKRIHMAIVVDEYGGTSGLITMEDILEEVFGEIKDEFDEDELVYSKLDDATFVFEGNTLLNDVLKIINIPADYFDELEDEADSLAGLLMEIHQAIPSKNDKIKFKDITFTIESADKRRVKRVKIQLGKALDNNEEEKEPAE